MQAHQALTDSSIRTLANALGARDGASVVLEGVSAYNSLFFQGEMHRPLNVEPGDSVAKVETLLDELATLPAADADVRSEVTTLLTEPHVHNSFASRAETAPSWMKSCLSSAATLSKRAEPRSIGRAL